MATRSTGDLDINALQPTQHAQRGGSALSRLEPLLAWAIFAAFLLLYAGTTAPSIVELFDDSLEFQFVLPTFGIAHPTGYPLYTLAGGVWSNLLPFGNWAWRVNLFSAVAAAATVALLFVLAQRLTAVGEDAPHRRSDGVWAGLVAATAFGLGPVWWQQATVAEVYALHNLLVVTVLLLAVDLPNAAQQSQDRRMALLLALVGLGLAHHRTTVLLLPALLLYFVWTAPALLRPRRVWLIWLAALAAPFLLYLYLPLRATQGAADLNGSYVNTWNGFWDHVLARRYTSFFAENELTHSYDMGGWLLLWLQQTGWVGIGLSLLGLGLLLDRKARPAWGLIILVLMSNLIFALLYRVGDPEVFLLPVFLCAALLAGGGLTVLRRSIRLRWPAATNANALVSAAVGILLIGGIGRGAVVDRSDEWAAHDYAVDMAKVDFPAASRVIGIEGEMTALRYMQRAEQLGLAATPIVANEPERRRAMLDEALAAGAPAFLTRELEGIDGTYTFSGEGPLVRVWPRGQSTEHTPSVRTDLPLLDGQLLIEGYDLERLAWAGGPVVRATLYWRPLAVTARDLKVSLRVVDRAGEPLLLPGGAAAVSDAYPLRQVAPTSTWATGAQVRDVHEVRLPPDNADATVLMIIYDAETLVEMGRIQAPLP